MTTNLDRAAEVIAAARKDATVSRDGNDLISPHIAQALADAGLLAPDFPAPDIKAVFPVWIPDDDVEMEVQALANPEGDHVALSYHGTDQKKHHLVMDPHLANRLGGALIAAARHTPEEA